MTPGNPHGLLRRRFVLPCALAALGAATLPLAAQLPTARLDTIFPQGLRAGTETEVTIAGADLDAVDRLLFSDPGLSAVPVEGLKFKVTASAGMAPGVHEIRAAGRYGISASKLFVVGSFPEVSEAAPNASPATATEVALPVTINGTTGPDAADHFRFKASAGQRMLLSCAAERIDSPLNAVIAVADAAGRELLTAHRNDGDDASIDFTAPVDGDYTARVHDMAWGAAPYRLTIAAPEESAAAPVTSFPLAGAVVRPSEAPLTALPAPARDSASAHKVALPAHLAGSAETEWIEFTPDQARRVSLDLLSHRLGAPSDFVIRLLKVARDAKGAETMEQLAILEDSAAPPGTEPLALGSRDPSGEFACEAGTTYRLQIIDRFRAGRTWRLALRDPQPGFALVAFSLGPQTRGPAIHRWSPLLRKGASSCVSVAVIRYDGFADPIQLRVEGLPEGVSAPELTVPPGVGQAAVVVRASAAATTWNGRIRIMGSAGSVTAVAAEAVPRWNVGNTAAERVEMRLSTDGFPLAVLDSEAPPLTIEPAEEKVYETAIGGAVEIPVKFTRDAALKGIKGEWEAVLTGLPGLRQAPVVKPPGDAAEAKLVLDVKNKDGNAFSPGTWTVHASARATLQWQPGGEKAPVRELADAIYSAPIKVRIDASPVSLTLPESIAIAPGATIEIPVRAERRFGFADAITLQLAAPTGTSCEAVTIPKEATEGKLILKAAPDAPHGPHKTTVNAKCPWNGVEVPWALPITVEVKP
jgi:hypothetical protein